MLIEVKAHRVTFTKVKGHANVELNERCDQLATGAIDNYRKLIAEKASSTDTSAE